MRIKDDERQLRDEIAKYPDMQVEEVAQLLGINSSRAKYLAVKLARNGRTPTPPCAPSDSPTLHDGEDEEVDTELEDEKPWRHSKTTWGEHGSST